MSNMIEKIKSSLEQKVTTSMGVSRIWSWQFFAVLGLYLAVLIVAANDPFFGGKGNFSYQQGFFPILTGLVVAATLNWEIMWFGKSRGSNLLLQFMLLPIFALWMARIIGTQTKLFAARSMTQEALDWLKELSQTVIGIGFNMPTWLKDLMDNPCSLGFMFLVIIMLSIRHKIYRIGALIAVITIPFVNTLIHDDNSIFLIIETCLLLAGMAIQFCRYDQVIYYENIYLRINRSNEIDKAVAKIVLRIMTMLLENNVVTENNLYSIVRSEYSKDDTFAKHFSENDIKIFSGEISRRMVYEYDIAKIEITPNGMQILPNPKLFMRHGILTGIAIFPRMLILGLIAIIWILSPIDILPDAIPFVGVLDDVAVAILSMTTLNNTRKLLK